MKVIKHIYHTYALSNMIKKIIGLASLTMLLASCGENWDKEEAKYPNQQRKKSENP